MKRFKWGAKLLGLYFMYCLWFLLVMGIVWGLFMLSWSTFIDGILLVFLVIWIFGFFSALRKILKEQKPYPYDESEDYQDLLLGALILGLCPYFVFLPPMPKATGFP